MKTQVIIAAAAIAGVGGFCLTLATYSPAPDPAAARFLGNGGSSPVSGRSGRAPRGSGDPATDIPIQMAYVREHPEKPQGWYWLGKSRQLVGEPQAALDCWARAVEVLEKSGPTQDVGWYHYRMAKYLALCGEQERAVAAWIAAVDGGFGDPERAQSDVDLDSIRADERFGEALKRVVARPRVVLGAG